MAAFPDLRDAQQLFWDLIAAPEGVAAGAHDLAARGELPDTDLSFFVAGDERLDAAGRLDVYADMYFYRLRDCLAEDFPKLAALVQPDRFHNLVTDFLLAHPPSHFSLRELGRPLPEFLRGHALAAEVPASVDLAALEWARVDVFDAPDARPLARADLKDADPETLRLSMVPAARLLDLASGTLPIWRHLDEERSQDPPPLGTQRVGVCVWRKDFSVVHRALAGDEARSLDVLAGGNATLTDLGEQVLESAPDAPEARLAELLASWLDAGLVTEAG